MPRRKLSDADRPQLPAHLHSLILSLAEKPPQAPENLRARVQIAVEINRGVRDLIRTSLSELITATSGKMRILQYLQLFPTAAIDSDELAVISGIQEFARRVRELRVEHGYRIASGLSRDDLRPDQYVLEESAPNEAEADKWRKANAIRQRSGSAESRILALLQEYVGQVVRGDEIAYVAKIPSWRRRSGQLRTERGWRVATRFTGRPDLGNSEYILESLDQLPTHDREIPDDVYAAVLERDGRRCRRAGCGWDGLQRISGDPRQFLELHHIEHHAQGGQQNPENLITLCNVCHDSVHRAGVSGNSFFDWIQTPVVSTTG